MYFVIVQRYSDATDLFNYVDIIGPFDTTEAADRWTIDNPPGAYLHYTITSPTAPVSRNDHGWAIQVNPTTRHTILVPLTYSVIDQARKRLDTSRLKLVSPHGVVFRISFSGLGTEVGCKAMQYSNFVPLNKLVKTLLELDREHQELFAEEVEDLKKPTHYTSDPNQAIYQDIFKRESE
jgi:hypothetical protein